MDWSKVHWEMDEDEEKDIVLLEETPTTKPTDSVPVIKAPVPRPRKRKINLNADSHLPPRKKNKKVTKKTETSSAKGDIEDQFFAIPKSQQIMILQNTHHEEWETMVEAVGINDVEQLKYLLNRETIWDMEITKQDLIIALDETGQSINKKLRPYWKINTISFYLIKKRMLLLQMNRHKDHQGNHQSICKVYKQALNQRQTATETARKKDAKRKETSGNNNNNNNSNSNAL
eukprot:1034587_1